MYFCYTAINFNKGSITAIESQCDLAQPGYQNKDEIPGNRTGSSHQLSFVDKSTIYIILIVAIHEEDFISHTFGPVAGPVNTYFTSCDDIFFTALMIVRASTIWNLLNS